MRFADAMKIGARPRARGHATATDGRALAKPETYKPSDEQEARNFGSRPISDLSDLSKAIFKKLLCEKFSLQEFFENRPT